MYNKISKHVLVCLLLLVVAAISLSNAEPTKVKLYYGLIGSDDYIWGTVENMPTDAWARFPSAPVALMDNASATDGNYNYYGIGYGGTREFYRHAVGDTVWQTLTPCPQVLCNGGAAIVGDTFYYCAGYSYDSGTPIDTLWKYCISSGTWTSGPGPFTATTYNWSPLILACQGKVYYISGCNQPGATNPSTQVWAYTPGTGWAQRASMNQGRVFAHGWVHHDTIYVTGGNTNNVGTAASEFYSPFTNTWTINPAIFPPMPGPVWGGASGKVDDTVGFVATGVGVGLLNSTYYFRLGLRTWSTEAGVYQTVYRTTGLGDASNRAFIYGGSLSGFTPTRTCQQNFFPLPFDMTTTLILSPTSLDSGMAITPQAVIRNYGTQNASDFMTRFKIFQETPLTLLYEDSIFTSRLVPMEIDTLTFTSFTLNVPRGNYVLKCSTEFGADMLKGNDKKEIVLPLRIHNVGVVAISSPPNSCNLGDPIVPSAWIRNYGTVPETFGAKMRIGPSYDNNAMVSNIQPDSQLLINFPLWLAGPPGLLNVKCTTMLSTDLINGNDFKTKTVQVNIQNDVGITAILNPLDTVYKGDMKPKIRLRNFGINSQDPECIFHGYDSIGTEVYCDTEATTVGAGLSVDLEFDKYWTLDSGNYSCFAERYYPPDEWLDNDTMSKDFFVKPTFIDFQLLTINSPTATVMKGSIPVSVTVKNLSLIAVSFFDVMFRIMDSAATTELYNDTAQAVSIGPNVTQTLVFNPWTCTIPGWYNGYAEILTPDANGDNDTLSILFKVIAGIPDQWVKMADIGFGEKPVGKGGCLAFFPDSGWVYGLKGNNKPAFGYYSVATNTWTPLADIPFAPDKNKSPKAGAAMTLAGKYLYVPKGGNRLEFWRYGVPGADSTGWKQLLDVPAGGKKVKGGTVLAPVKLNDTDYIFMAKGSKTNEAYLYNPATSAWGAALSGVPLFDKSTSGAGFNESLVYAITYDKGTKTNTVFLGNLKTNTWAKTADVPLIGTTTKKKKIKEGSALTHDGTQFYMFKGGNIKEFFDYTPGESVKPRADIPITTKKGVKGGASLAFGNGYVWAFPGNKLNEFWQYTPVLPVPAAYIPTTSLEGAMDNKLATGSFKLAIVPNPAINQTAISYSLPVPGPVNFKLYNVAGSLVKTYTNAIPTKNGVITIDANALPSGVYILRFNADDIRVTRKLVLEK